MAIIMLEVWLNFFSETAYFKVPVSFAAKSNAFTKEKPLISILMFAGLALSPFRFHLLVVDLQLDLKLQIYVVKVK